MGEDPSRIRAEIEQTRAEMGDTVDALGYKTDVKSRTKDKMTDTKDRLTGKVTGAKDSVLGTVSDKTPDSGEVKGQAKRAASVAQENPLGLAIGGIAVGFLAGLLIPTSRIEDEKIGPVAEQVREQVKQTGQEALEHGKEVAQEAATSAKETVQQSGQEHAEQLKDSTQQRAQETQSEVSSGSGSPSRTF
jgi:gas vesicle protein